LQAIGEASYLPFARRRLGLDVNLSVIGSPILFLPLSSLSSPLLFWGKGGPEIMVTD